MKPVIKVENLSKSYLIGHERQERYTALRDVLTNTAKGFVKNAANLFRGQQLMGNDDIEEFYALKDVSFEVQQGDRIGIIGRNGAGKSTLLKILSRITEPTSGRVTINGRVASLLEVGTGFHPELTGRENIYLNGAILGMSRAEVKRKFDEIVDFAEVEKFLDTPVKRYSSGMYVRLAFAVAAHLEPEILIVDEVLAVGDAQFQKKCLGKMEDVSKNEGRTVLFVSHNMAVMNTICSTGILLNNGSLIINDNISSCISTYDIGSAPKKNNNYYSDTYLLKGINLNNYTYKIWDNIILYLELNKTKIKESILLSLEIYNDQNKLMSHITNEDDNFEITYAKTNIEVTLLNINLSPGIYTINIYIGTNGYNKIEEHKEVVSFQIINELENNFRTVPYPNDNSVVLKTNWYTKK